MIIGRVVRLGCLVDILENRDVVLRLQSAGVGEGAAKTRVVQKADFASPKPT